MSRMLRAPLRFGVRVWPAALMCLALAGMARAEGWGSYGGDPGGSHYSTLSQINRGNVAGLELAWQFRTGAVKNNPALKSMIDFQATPILLPADAGGHLVVCDPFNKVFALDPATGAERWAWDPQINKTPYAGRFKCKGLAFWRDSLAPPDAACAARLFMPAADKRLFAIDARDGRLCAGFGNQGVVDFEPLLAALQPADGTQGTQLVTPAAVVRDTVVVSTTSNKFRSASSVNGAIRGFDARSGALKWTWDPLVREPQPGIEPTPANVGGGNTWVPMSVDDERDLVFVPTASPAPNYWGAHRPGDNKWANSIVALRGSTGELVWGFQTLHHDVWDRDVGSPPIAVDMRRNGQTIPALFQLVKTGMLFSFNRETGEPLFPIEERPVPTNTDIAGEQLSPTQPFPVKPPVLVRNTLSPDDAWGFTVFDRNACRKKIAGMRHGSHYEPMDSRGTVMYPQPGGGANWGGGAFDPAAQPAGHAGIADSVLREAGAEGGGGSRVRQAPGGRRAHAGAGLHRRHALRRDAGAAHVAFVLALHRAAVGTAGGGGHGQGRDQVESALRRTRQADAGADSARLRHTGRWRAHHHGGRAHFHRRHCGCAHSRL